MIMILMKTKQSDRLVTRDAVLFIFKSELYLTFLKFVDKYDHIYFLIFYFFDCTGS